MDRCSSLFSKGDVNAFVGVAAAADYTLSSVDLYTDNDNMTILGFALSLNSTAINHDGVTLPKEAILEEFTVKEAETTAGNNITYGFVVLDSFGNNTVLGVSTGTATSTQNAFANFTFKAVDGRSPLTISTSSTYRYIAVGQDVLDLIASDSSKSYVFNGDGAGAVQHTTSGNTVTVTKGLKTPGIGGYQHSDVPADSAIIAAGNLGSVYVHNNMRVSPILSNIQLSNVPTPAIPEPATATLLLLALTGLAVRRRRT